MEPNVLQLTLLTLCGAVVVPVRLIMRSIRRPLLNDLARTGRHHVRLAVVVADVTSTLVYGAFVLAAVPFEYDARTAAFHFESALDSVALFALVVAFVEVVAVLAIRRTALNLEQWPAGEVA